MNRTEESRKVVPREPTPELMAMLKEAGWKLNGQAVGAVLDCIHEMNDAAPPIREAAEPRVTGVTGCTVCGEVWAAPRRNCYRIDCPTRAPAAEPVAPDAGLAGSSDDLIARLSAYDKHNHRGQYAKLCHEAAAALSAARTELARQNEANDMLGRERDAFQTALSAARSETGRWKGAAQTNAGILLDEARRADKAEADLARARALLLAIADDGALLASDERNIRAFLAEGNKGIMTEICPGCFTAAEASRPCHACGRYVPGPNDTGARDLIELRLHVRAAATAVAVLKADLAQARNALREFAIFNDTHNGDPIRRCRLCGYGWNTSSEQHRQGCIVAEGDKGAKG